MSVAYEYSGPGAVASVMEGHPMTKAFTDQLDQAVAADGNLRYTAAWDGHVEAVLIALWHKDKPDARACEMITGYMFSKYESDPDRWLKDTRDAADKMVAALKEHLAKGAA